MPDATEQHLRMSAIVAVGRHASRARKVLKYCELAEAATDSLGRLAVATPETYRDARRAPVLITTISPGRLFADSATAVRRLSRGFTKSERASLTSDVALLIMRWTAERSPHRADAGARAGCLPLRRDWLAEIEGTVRPGESRFRLSVPAWRMLRDAVVQAARADTRKLASDGEEPTEGESLAAMAQRLDSESGNAPDSEDVPDGAAAEVLALALDAPVAVGRAIVAAAAGRSPRELAEDWNVSAAMAAKSVSTGRAWIAKRYPDPADLLADLRAAVANLRDVRRDTLDRALADAQRWQTADDWHAARVAAMAYRDSVRVADSAKLALETACRRAALRSGGDEMSPADRAAWIRRLLTAETRRARATIGNLPGSVPMADGRRARIGAVDNGQPWREVPTLVADGKRERVVYVPDTRPTPSYPRTLPGRDSRGRTLPKSKR